MSCGTHICPRACHTSRDHDDLKCRVRVQTELPCSHKHNHECHQSKTLPDACFACKLAQRKAGVDEAGDGNEAGTGDRSPASADHRPPTSPTSSSWRDRQAATTTNDGIWRSGRSTDHLTNVFSMYRGPRQSSDTYRDGLFNKPKSPSDSFYSPSGGFGRGGFGGRGGYSSRGGFGSRDGFGSRGGFGGGW
jgi:hypothetical protein